MARILGFHPRGPSSIPGVGDPVFKFIFAQRFIFQKFNQPKILNFERIKIVLPHRELNPGLSGESRVSQPLDHVGCDDKRARRKIGMQIFNAKTCLESANTLQCNAMSGRVYLCTFLNVPKTRLRRKFVTQQQIYVVQTSCNFSLQKFADFFLLLIYF